MKYKDFETIITSMQELQKRDTQLNDLGVDLLEYNELFYKTIELLMRKAFSAYHVEWIEWFLYERITPGGEILKAYDEHDKEICYDIRSLWEEVNK